MALVAEGAIGAGAARAPVVAALVTMGAVGRAHRVMTARLDARHVAAAVVGARRAIVALRSRDRVVAGARERRVGVLLAQPGGMALEAEVPDGGLVGVRLAGEQRHAGVVRAERRAVGVAAE